MRTENKHQKKTDTKKRVQTLSPNSFIGFSGHKLNEYKYSRRQCQKQSYKKEQLFYRANQCKITGVIKKQWIQPRCNPQSYWEHILSSV